MLPEQALLIPQWILQEVVLRWKSIPVQLLPFFYSLHQLLGHCQPLQNEIKHRSHGRPQSR